MMAAGRSLLVSLVLVAALTACRRSTEVPASSGSESDRVTLPAKSKKRTPLDLAYQNMSFFHGDGQRLAFVRDGRVIFERLQQRDTLVRWETRLESGLAADLARIVDRLASGTPEIKDRPGIPDEVRVLIHYRDTDGKLSETGIWEADTNKLPADHVISKLMVAVGRAAASITSSGAGKKRPSKEGGKWPPVFSVK
jgi:hypothetical protein